ncbi:MAG: polysaccharide pyruvyl transferase family protein [Propionibacteriaceae bacterium]|jgi:hypothetical protein|nr:polysaccharide pyruvyl transferase family protein [Propionibacteriaceae bacterium]
MASPKRILMRAGKAPHEVLSPEASLAYRQVGVFATNLGNMAFATAVYRHLKVPGTEIRTDGMTLQYPGVTDADCARINEKYDALVLPLANAFRGTAVDFLNNLADVIERLTIPVVVVGVGGQARGDTIDNVRDDVAEATTRFVKAVLERSESIGVRGEATYDFLRSLGFGEDRVDVVGCPSMFDYDHAGHVEKPDSLSAESPMAINISPYVPGAPEYLRWCMERYPNLMYMPQRDAELRLLLWGEPISQSAFRDGMPVTADDPLVRQGRMRMCVDLSTWSQYLAKRQFSFGTRIHGTIVALHSGIPAFLLAHDSRTAELAEYHHIPHLRVRRVKQVGALKLFEQADYTEYNQLWPQHREVYARFLERNGLAHGLDPANRDAEYEAMLKAVEFPPPVAPLGADPSQLYSRLNWLWQGSKADLLRPGNYRPEERAGTEFPAKRPLPGQVRQLQKRVHEHELILQNRWWPKLLRRMRAKFLKDQ